MNWTIKNFRKYESGKLKGFFTLKASVFEINDCKYFVGDKGGWASLPDKKYTDKDGTENTALLSGFRKTNRKAFKSGLLLKLQRYFREINQHKQSSQWEKIFLFSGRQTWGVYFATETKVTDTNQIKKLNIPVQDVFKYF